MKIIFYFLLCFLMGVLETYSQTTTSTETESTTVVSVNGEVVNGEVVNGDTDISLSRSENSYFSTSDSDDTFKVRAKYNKEKTKKVKEYLLEELGDNNMVKSDGQLKWTIKYNGDKSYEVKLDEGSLRIYVDKELTSPSMVNKFKTIAKNIKAYTTGKSDEKREEERVEREQDRLKREADRKIREADRLRREAERLKREAERLERESKGKTNTN